MTAAPSMDRSVTAIIATYNRARYIEQAIDSILGQHEPVRQLIVVDDGSVDDTAARVRKYWPAVEYVHKPNGGKSSAVNLGLALAKGEWIWLFDDDDIAMPDATRLLLDALEAEPDADLAYGGQVIADEAPDGRLVGHREVLPAAQADDRLLLDVMLGFCFRMQAMLIRRSCFDRVGPLDEQFLRGQDYELIVRLIRHFRATRVLEPIFIWRQHAGERGPANLKHAADQRDRHWSEFDALLGREIRAKFRLGEFLVPRTNSTVLATTEQSIALFNRAAVMAAKGLIDEFVNDLGAAVALMPGNAVLSRSHCALLFRACANPRFLTRLATTREASIESFQHLPKLPAIRDAVACVVRTLVYQYRHASAESAPGRSQLLSCILSLSRIAGPLALARAYRR